MVSFNLTFYITVVVIILGALGAFGVKAYKLGEDHAKVQFQHTIDQINAAKDAEVKRQRDINDQTRKELEKNVADLQEKNDKLNEDLQTAAAAAGKDVHAHRPALGADSVQRLNRVSGDHSASGASAAKRNHLKGLF